MMLNCNECLICGKSFGGTKQYRKLAGHLMSVHATTSQLYYEKYVGLGKCNNCGTPTKFLDIRQGFVMYCSCLCANTHIDKIKKTEHNNFVKYGVGFVSKMDESKKKSRSTCLEKYGVEHNFQRREFINKISISDRLLKRNDHLRTMGVEWRSVSEDGQYTMFCYKCNSLFDILPKTLKSRETLNHCLCTNCAPLMLSTSQYEHRLADGLSCINERMITNRRHIIPPLELDIYFPRLKIAVEFNGLFWHSSANKDGMYHKMKSDLCNNTGIRLIHVYEDDWQKNPSVVLNKVRDIIYRSDLNNITFDKYDNIEEIDQILAKSYIKSNELIEWNESWDMLKYIAISRNGYIVALGIVDVDTFDVNIVHYCHSFGETLGGVFLISDFLRSMYITNTITYVADRSWISERDLPIFERWGFICIDQLPPTKWNIVNNRRVEFDETVVPAPFTIQNSGYFSLKWSNDEVF